MKEMADLFKIDDPSFSIEQKEMVYNILSRHSGAISRGKSDLGDLKTSQHFIDTGEARPIRVPVRRLPYHQREEARKEIETMLASNVIEASESPWSAPVVMVRKKDGTLRFCVDYRKLNQVTKKDVYPLPRCDDVLEALSGAIFFTHLDLVRGYWQLGVNKVDREKTAFSTPEGHFQFKRMPFGLTNAPATFQRAMNTILNGLTWTDCLVYLDDIVIFARDFQEHNRRLEAVLERLETAGVKLNAKKCELLKTETLILGHVVSQKGIATDPEKVKALKEFPEPHDLTTLRSFLGCAGYYRQFIPNFADIAPPLYGLERKGANFKWTTECQAAFDTLKRRLTSSPILAYPNFDRPFILDTDASDTGLGAVLSQVQNGKERVIAYAAKALSKSQRNYSTTRKELLALIWGMEHFEPYLLGREFMARTDHNALTWLNNFKQPKGQVARWLERLAEFHFSIEHRPGRLHGNADGLSRVPPREDEEPDQTTKDRGQSSGQSVQFANCAITYTDGWACRWNNDELVFLQRDDPVLQEAVKWAESGARPSRNEIRGVSPEMGSMWSQFERLKLVNGVLCREYELENESTKILQVCLPRKIVPEILELIHALPTSGHLGSAKTCERIKSRYYWKGWREDVKNYCRQCQKCAQRNPPRKKPRAPLVTSRCGYPMERVAMDIVGPLPRTKRGNRFIIVVNDYFTRWPEAFAVVDHEAETVAKKLMEQWISRFGVMQYLHTDQGREFESKVFQALCSLLGIKKTRTTPYHPQSDGLVERNNRTIKDMLSKVVNENHDDWDEWIPHVLLAYRTAVQSSTGFTPHKMLFGREARIPIDLMLEAPIDHHSVVQDTPTYVQETKAMLQRVHELARTKTGESSKRYKDYYDSTSSDTVYKVGDKVWLHQPSVKKGLSRKLARPWCGPYTIVKKLSDVVFRIQKDGRGRKRTVVHFNRLKPCLLNKEENDRSAGPKTTLETLKKNVKKTQRNPDRSEQSTDDEDDVDIPPERNRHRHKELIRTRDDPEPIDLPESSPGATPETTQDELQDSGAVQVDVPERPNMAVDEEVNNTEEQDHVEVGEDTPLMRPRRERRTPVWKKDYRKA